MSDYQQVRDARLADPSIFTFQKDAIQRLERIDVLDAMYILEDLRELFMRRYAETTGRPWEEPK